ncbi:protein NipSnap homolog 3A isoform X2 [Piliocolobus tephrosceles]|uniref:protein NipSnap homolog 3A isoform X2 n=1 Tax=Piliocolobus tephrosceles TaxID=591936 RepID=UPI000E6B42E9|nr:protein NipSnap homolog 3A isoform X2 [Piliocolobus tephrosceles]
MFLKDRFPGNSISTTELTTLALSLWNQSTLFVCSSFATGPRQYDGTFYEFRTYYLKPSKMNAFMENLKKTIHLRTAHSELVGFWSIEFGGRMNKVFHIWKYVHVLWWNESADSRAAGRHKSHEDPRVVAAEKITIRTVFLSKFPPRPLPDFCSQLRMPCLLSSHCG